MVPILCLYHDTISDSASEMIIRYPLLLEKCDVRIIMQVTDKKMSGYRLPIIRNYLKQREDL